MAIGIYKITSPTGKIYIGQSWDIDKRFCEYKNKRCKQQRLLYHSLKKHTPEAHVFTYEYIFGSTTKQELDLKEIELIQHYKALGFQMLNLAYGGEGFGMHSEETKELIRAKRALQPPPTLGKFYAAPKPKKEPKPRTFWVGRKHSAESKAKQAAAKLGTNNKALYKLVLSTKTGIYYDSVTDAAKSLGMKMPTLSNKMLGKVSNNTGMVYV